MPLFDLPLEQLQTYQPERSEPADFDLFWQNTLAETRQHPLDARFEPVEAGLKTLEVFDLTFGGYGGQPIKGWFLLPKHREGRLPCVVEYIGYGGGRGFALEWLTFASAGYAHLVMDTRGQGSRWRKGDTPDLAPDGDNPQHPGFMTRGVLSPHTYYYRRVFTDAVRAVEAARSHPSVDAHRIAVTGGSQGGGISLAVAGLTEVQAVLPDVPFLCHYRRATELVDTAPYNEISWFCRIHRDKHETVFHTLSYFDGVNFAARAKATALFSVGLMDDICPPSTVYAAYNHYAGPKEIKVYPYNNHEGGEGFQTLEAAFSAGAGMVEALRRARVVGVLRAPSAESAVEAALAAVRGGLQTLELTFTTPKVTQALRELRERLPQSVLLGAGTVMNTREAEAALEAGARFLVSPHLGEDVLELCRTRGVPYIPGVLTPTEIARARSLGAEVVKIFPAVGGIAYLRDLLGPFPDLKIMATGGIKPGEVPAYLQAGVLAVGLGSNLFPRAALESGDWKAVEAATRRVLAEAGVSG